MQHSMAEQNPILPERMCLREPRCSCKPVPHFSERAGYRCLRATSSNRQSGSTACSATLLHMPLPQQAGAAHEVATQNPTTYVAQRLFTVCNHRWRHFGQPTSRKKMFNHCHSPQIHTTIPSTHAPTRSRHLSRPRHAHKIHTAPANLLR